MPDRRPCPSCGYLNTARAESCASCGKPLDETSAPVHPGETLRDPDDLTLPPSPLLRAVLRGEPEAAVAPLRAPATSPPETPVTPLTPVTTATVEQLSPSADQAALLRDLAERLQARKVEPRAEPVVRYAGFFVRVGAFLVDGLVLGAFGVPLTAAGYLGIRAGMLVIGHSEPIEPDETVLTLLTAGWFAMATVYFTVLHRSYGQTIGKALFGLEVRTIDLREVGVVRCLVRTLGYAVSSSFLGFGFLLVALTPRKRGWHDFLAGTCVIRVAPEEASA